ncbi:MAG: DUF839 domain-containing protein [Rhodobacteraceae bacterium]|nr:DUF839 domain-containing protein [Paracoccaceae bacterium]
MLRTMLTASTALAAVFGGFATLAHAGNTITFAPVSAPVTDAEKRDVRASAEVTVNAETAKIGYHTVLRAGDKVGSGTFGLILDEKGEPVITADGAPDISDSTDFSSIIEKDGKLYILSHFESRPAAVYMTKVEQDAATGQLTAVDTQSVDFSADGGLWVPCAGSVTPWGTHLGSEEYEPDAQEIEAAADLSEIDDYTKPMALYFGVDAMATENPPSVEAFRKVFNPYRYGYITEISVGDDETPEAVKHYSMGRLSHELGYVLPDEKTAYLSDDGTNVGLYRFVADEKGKLDAGTLYAAKFTQTSAENGGAMDITWIDLGHAASADIKAMVDKGIKFSDIFESTAISEDGTCGEGFTASAANGVKECLKVKPGMDLAASRLETRRYAAIKGASVELRKEEGVTYDPDHHRVYVAISEISNGMEDFMSKGKESAKYDVPGANQLALEYNPCGGVYALELDDDYAATTMKAIITGKPTTYPEGSDFAGNTCDIDGLANPDNVSYIAGFNTLLIGEDTESGHQNDAVWSLNLDSMELTRILTTPYGAETTSVYNYPDVNGHGYIMAVVQHPYGESDEDKLSSPDQLRAYLGYVGPLPKF